ncbi:MAG: hypothetical protein I3273_03145 [Candidatus Moeniiplasma glomeromycotorum]|nr:hypothetical protein [Candidatus Moeniiplasma glomeromycotorum]MCE8167550.1 hypothetical protein [Candidatus Moeniiplasma glomeromycotorum]MCE8169098.1 hypothetical protein [Candidatus Moeniiplasma glomeromycotorum]
MASAQRRIFYAALNLLIIDPVATAGLAWYFWNQINGVALAGGALPNLGSTLKYTAISIAVKFTFSSLGLLYYLWKVSSLQSQIAKINSKLRRLETRG